MTLEERRQITSNEYINILTEYKRSDLFMKGLEGYPGIEIDDKYKVIFLPKSSVGYVISKENGYAVIPKIYSLLNNVDLDAMGVTAIQNAPNLALKGEGVLLGFIDTGIDYTNPVFRSSDGRTRIATIWDQTIENLDAGKNTFYFGTEYSREQIDNALMEENPHLLVPSTDEIGHGTMMAGIAGGSEDKENSFQGVVPLAEFAVVKLKLAKPIIRDFFLVPDNVPCYQQDDIMLAVHYLMNFSSLVNKPIVICIGLGTNQGGHDGTGILEDMLSAYGTQLGKAFIIAAGNEGSSKSHYFGMIDKALGYDEVELSVGADENGFSMELWGYAPNTYSIDILSPSGQYVPRIVGRLGENRKIDFIFDNTTVNVNHLIIESQTGDPMILLRFMKPSQGIWRFRVYAAGRENSHFHIWLPISGFISSNTFFLKSDPNTTITSPGDAFRNTTVTTYNSANNEIYINASRGYTRNGNVKPDIAAPGVNVMAPVAGKNNEFVNATGSSVAAAHTSGLAAMLFEWGIVKGNYETMSGMQVERFLIRGVAQDSMQQYPNQVWGYGRANIYNTFLSLSAGIFQ